MTRLNNSERPLLAADGTIRMTERPLPAAANTRKERGLREKTLSRCGKKIWTQRVNEGQTATTVVGLEEVPTLKSVACKGRDGVS
ncbi:hypothetical protein PoB_002996500 [Plakobranchus ocellatus]|uniref:Uncharacterized protein n=1 Tax=Plakobranchus ocellatus TaxID=259542 RepID=A0AAV4A5N3_9GAST|nr:hypothetical protein PoB_002996500 [Plakobranchus ocellatus]